MADERDSAVHSAFMELIGWRMASWTEGAATLTYTVSPAHLNRGGLLHGGVIATLLDAAAGYAAIGAAPTQEFARTPKGVTVSFTINYMGMARAGDALTVTARRTGGGKTIAFASARIVDQDDRVVAEGTGAFRRLDPRT